MSPYDDISKLIDLYLDDDSEINTPTDVLIDKIREKNYHPEVRISDCIDVRKLSLLQDLKIHIGMLDGEIYNLGKCVEYLEKTSYIHGLNLCFGLGGGNTFENYYRILSNPAITSFGIHDLPYYGDYDKWNFDFLITRPEKIKITFTGPDGELLPDIKILLKRNRKTRPLFECFEEIFT